MLVLFINSGELRDHRAIGGHQVVDHLSVLDARVACAKVIDDNPDPIVVVTGCEQACDLLGLRRRFLEDAGACRGL